MITLNKPQTKQVQQYNTKDLQTVQLALHDAIELAEQKGDLNLAVIYAKLLRERIDPALKRGYGI